MKEAAPPNGYARLRRLSDEEIELWLKVTGSVAPRPGRTLPVPKSSAQVSEAAEPMVSEAARLGPPPPPADPPASLPSLAQLDRRMRQRLARGQAGVDAAIDLHGMRQAEAHRALHGFLQRCQRDGAKLVLVVTGKGEGRDEYGFAAQGVLRRGVPLWLRAPDWRSLVVGFEEASRQHGGAGALYVRLRRLDRTPGKRRGLT